MSWTRLTSITANNGSNIITVNSGSTTNIKVGDALLVEGFDLVEIEGVFASQLQTKTTWKAPTQSNVSAAVVPTFGDFNNAVEEIRKLRQVTTDNLDAMEKWGTQSNGTVTFQSYNGDTVEVRTAQEMDSSVKQIEQVAKDTITEVETFGVVMTEAQAMAIREQNKRKYAASDFIYHGRHADSAANGYFPINEGLWSLTGIPNTLWMGRGASNQYYGGKSKSDFPVFNIDGVTVPLVTHPTAPQFEILLPECPDGTATYDSATGVVTDFTTDVDPKYGDVAGTVNEAVSRAFGTFQDGDTVFFSGGATYNSSTKELTHPQSASGITFQGIPTERTTLTLVVSSTRDCEYSVKDSTSGAAADPTLATFTITADTLKTFVLDLTGRTTTGIYLRLNNGSSPAITTLHFVGAVAGKVVTERVDMTALEFWPELITDDEVFPHCIQNQSTTFGDTGIPTVVSDRPESYFQVFEGQTGIQKGRCVKWSALTSAQKHAVATYLGESFYKTAAGLVQWRERNRGFAGLGNGDWSNVDSTKGVLRFDSVVNVTDVRPQGAKDIAPDYTAGYPNASQYLGDSNGALTSNNAVGVFSARADSVLDVSAISYTGECYMYVIATVPRLNQGAYHPALNNGGAGLPASTTGTNSYWWGPNVVDVHSTLDCFLMSYQDSNGNVLSGYIGTSSGRQDGRYFDAIYASGLGGVVDHRLPYGAWGAPVQEAISTYREAIKDGSFRGVERRWFTRVLPNRIYKAADGIYDPAQNGRIRIGTNATTEWIDGANDNEAGYATSANVVKTLLVGDNGSVYEIPTGRYGDIYSSTTYTYFGATELGNFNSLFPNGTWIYVVQTSYVPFGINFPQVSAEGTDTFMDVFAAPSVILAEPIFSNGWFGGYCGSPLPVGGVDMVFSRKVADGSTPIRTYLNTETNAWSSGAMPNYSQVQNGSTDGWSASYHLLYTFNYPIKNSMTVVGPHEPVHNRLAGIVPWVFYSNHYALTTGSFLAADTLQVITKNNAVVVRLGEASLNGFALDTNGTIKLVTGSTSLAGMQHTPIQLGVPSNDSKATKHLFHAIKENGRLNMSIFSNEIIYDAVSGDWGNESVMYPGANTYLSDNHGAYYRATNHKLTKPLGWLNSEI